MPSSPEPLTPEQIRELEKKAAEVDEAERKARERGMAWLAETKEVRVSPPQEFVDAFDEWCKVDAVERDIQELEMVKPVGVTEILAQRQALSELNAERARLLALLDGRESPPAQVQAKPQEVRLSRAHTSSGLIARARKNAGDGAGIAEIWLELMRMANAQEHPFIGVTDEGLKYQNDKDGVSFINRKSVSDWLRRRR